MQEWYKGKNDYITYRSDKYRWLVTYKGKEGEEVFNSWIGWLDHEVKLKNTAETSCAKNLLRNLVLFLVLKEHVKLLTVRKLHV